MEYMILIYGDESAWPNLSEAQLKAMYAEYGGYYLIDVPDLDAAVKWAGKCPGAKTGSCEVRPLAPSPK
jgi:hypothetical protein